MKRSPVDAATQAYDLALQLVDSMNRFQKQNGMAPVAAFTAINMLLLYAEAITKVDAGNVIQEIEQVTTTVRKRLEKQYGLESPTASRSADLEIQPQWNVKSTGLN